MISPPTLSIFVFKEDVAEQSPELMQANHKKDLDYFCM